LPPGSRKRLRFGRSGTGGSSGSLLRKPLILYRVCPDLVLAEESETSVRLLYAKRLLSSTKRVLKVLRLRTAHISEDKTLLARVGESYVPTLIHLKGASFPLRPFCANLLRHPWRTPDDSRPLKPRGHEFGHPHIERLETASFALVE
jgi:hypothetical protein